MGWWRRARIAAGILGAIVLVAAALPALTGRPLVSYAASASMEPTLGTFDAFLVVPFPGPVEVGDIIVFDSVTRGGPAVHRIVAGDGDSGWFTQGDANPQPDQAAGEPLVTRDRVLGKVVVGPDGAPIVLPQAGVAIVKAKIEVAHAARAVGGERQLAALGFLGVAVVSGAIAMAAPRRVRPPARLPRWARRALRRAFPRGILGRHLSLALLVILVASVAWTAAHARLDVPLTLVVLEDPTAADGKRAAGPGGSVTHDVEIGSMGYLPTLLVLEPTSPELLVDPGVARVGPGARAPFELEHRARDAVGLQEDRLHVWRYPHFLPAAAILELHAAAPGLPYAVLGGLAAAAGWTWSALAGFSRLPVGRMLGIREDWL